MYLWSLAYTNNWSSHSMVCIFLHFYKDCSDRLCPGNNWDKYLDTLAYKCIQTCYQTRHSRREGDTCSRRTITVSLLIRTCRPRNPEDSDICNRRGCRCRRHDWDKAGTCTPSNSASKITIWIEKMTAVKLDHFDSRVEIRIECAVHDDSCQTRQFLIWQLSLRIDNTILHILADTDTNTLRTCRSTSRDSNTDWPHTRWRSTRTTCPCSPCVHTRMWNC